MMWNHKNNIFISIIGILVYYLMFYFFVGRDTAIKDRLYSLKKNGMIEEVEKFYWEHDFKSIASFNVRFSNGKTGQFDYAKLNNGKIEFEEMTEYDGYIIYRCKIYKDGSGVTNILGYDKNLITKEQAKASIESSVKNYYNANLND